MLQKFMEEFMEKFHEKKSFFPKTSELCINATTLEVIRHQS